ncbi:alpha/beta hydrolase [Cohnella sp.]|uniref:alpha/beta hydrolase n=1 Tax=Cohnella sp. TaxID=1883426 RepID=UPI00356B4427
MKIEVIQLSSFWGTSLRQRHISVREGNDRLAVLFPGRNYPCELPLLYYAGNAALQHGFDLLILEYGYQAARTQLHLSDLPKVIDESFESVLSVYEKHDQIIFISKSLGTLVAGEVHQKLQAQVDHLFLTPLADTIPFIQATNGIVIYGENDPLFGPKEVEQIKDRSRTIVIPNADHGLETGNVKENLINLGIIVDVYWDLFGDRRSN